MFSPAYDINFWRHVSVSIPGLGSASDSETKVKGLLSIVVGFGVVF
jgi:hypothetical protein